MVGPISALGPNQPELTGLYWDCILPHRNGPTFRAKTDLSDLECTQLFFLCATPFGKRTFKTLLESVVLICCEKVTTANAICIKQVLYLGNDFSENLAPKFPSKSGAISRTPLPACPRKRTLLWCIFFALPAVNGPLPAEQKSRENTGGMPHLRVQHSET